MRGFFYGLLLDLSTHTLLNYLCDRASYSAELQRDSNSEGNGQVEKLAPRGVRRVLDQLVTLCSAMTGSPFRADQLWEVLKRMLAAKWATLYQIRAQGPYPWARRLGRLEKGNCRHNIG